MLLQKLFQHIIFSEYHLLPSRIEVEDDLIDICTIGFLTVNDISQNSFSSKARVRGGLGLNFSWCDDEIKDIMTNPGLGGIHKLRWQDEVGRWYAGNVNGM